MAIKNVVTTKGRKVGTFDDDALTIKLNWPLPVTLRIEDPIEGDVRKVAAALETPPPPKKPGQRHG